MEGDLQIKMYVGGVGGYGGEKALLMFNTFCLHNLFNFSVGTLDDQCSVSSGT